MVGQGAWARNARWLRPLGRRFLRSVVVWLGFLLLVSGNVFLLFEVRASMTDHVAIAQAADTIQSVVADVLTVDAANPAGGMERVLPRATGEFRRQIATQLASYASTLTAMKVNAKGSVAALGARDVVRDRVTFLIRGRSTVLSSPTAPGKNLSYNLSADVQRVDGQWYVAKLDFLP